MTPDDEIPITDPSLFDGADPFDAARWDNAHEKAKEVAESARGEIDSVAAGAREAAVSAIRDASRAIASVRSEAHGRAMTAVAGFENARDKINATAVKKVISVLRTSNAAIESLGGIPVRDLQMAFSLTLDDPPYLRSVDLLLGGALSNEFADTTPVMDPLPPPPPPPCPVGYVWDDQLQRCVSAFDDNPPPPPPLPPPPPPPPPPAGPPIPPPVESPFIPNPPAPLPPVPSDPPQSPLTPPPLFPPLPPCPPGYIRDATFSCVPDPNWVPPPPPPPPPEPADCLTPPPTVQLSCTILTPTWVTRWWVTVKCRGCKCPEVCVWSGMAPPARGDWDYLSPPYDRPPTPEEQRSHVLYCIDRCKPGDITLPPPTSPPTGEPPIPPPTSPPPPPADDTPTTPPRPKDQIVDPTEPKDWADAGYCRKIEFESTLDLDSDDLDFALREIGVNAADVVEDNIPSANNGFWGNVLAPIRPIVIALLLLPVSLLTTAVKLVTRIKVGKENADLARSIAYQIQAAPVRFADEWLGTNSAYYFQGEAYTANYLYPVYIPEQADVDAMFLGDYIDDNGWECWTRAHGNLPKPFRFARDGKATRTNPAELVQLMLRGKLTPGELSLEMRRRGVINPVEVEYFKALAEALPSQTDIIEYMRKGADNAANVAQDKLDEGFKENYTARLKKWANQQGISDEMMAIDWNAHWQEISPQMAFEMFVRLRPGRVPKELEFDKARLVKTLKEADYPPGLIDYMIAIAYAPITRTDLIKGNKAGVVSKKELIEGLMDVKYSPEDAKKLADIIDADNDRQRQNAFGVWTQRRIAQEYKAGTISRDKAEQLLRRSITDPDKVADLIDDIESLRDAEKAAVCIKEVKRRYMIGDLTEKESEIALMDRGVWHDQAVDMVERWQCERGSKAKEYTMGIVQKMYVRKMIDGYEAYTRLLHLRFDPNRAYEIVKLWDIEIDEDTRKRLEAEARRRITDARSARTDYIREVKFAAWVEDRAEKKKKKSQGGGGGKGGKGQDSGGGGE